MFWTVLIAFAVVYLTDVLGAEAVEELRRHVHEPAPSRPVALGKQGCSPRVRWCCSCSTTGRIVEGLALGGHRAISVPRLRCLRRLRTRRTHTKPTALAGARGGVMRDNYRTVLAGKKPLDPPGPLAVSAAGRLVRRRPVATA